MKSKIHRLFGASQRYSRILPSLLIIMGLTTATYAQSSTRKRAAAGARRVSGSNVGNPYGRRAGGLSGASRARSAVGRFLQHGEPSVTRATRSGAEEAAVLQGLLLRPRSLLYNHGFTAPVRRYNTQTMIGNTLYSPSQQDLQQARDDIINSDPKEKRAYSDILADKIDSERLRLIRDGWGYFHESDYVRSLNAFESAEMIDRSAPMPRFGQLISVFAASQFSRSQMKLAKIFAYHDMAPKGDPRMFDYKISLNVAFSSPDLFADQLAKVRGFAVAAPNSPSIQALLSYLLWYAGDEEGKIEAMSIADRIRRMQVYSPWAPFYPMMVKARQLEMDQAGAPKE